MGDELDEEEESWDNWEREVRERSVEGGTWLNQPESRVGRSPICMVEDGEEGE